MLAMAKEYEFLSQILCDRKDYHLLSYCYYYKLFRHRGTFMRVADEHKREFCEQIKKDYAVYKGFVKGNVGVDRWLLEAATRPDEVCDETINKKQFIISKLEAAKDIIIYGAGRRGDNVFRSIYNEGYYDKLCCFAISQEPSDELLAGKPILPIHEAHRLYPNALVIVAVIRGSGMYRQMVDNLTGLGINNYINGSDIEENFYIV